MQGGERVGFFEAIAFFNSIWLLQMDFPLPQKKVTELF